jgi:predicted anti-sigma-YlaC factor YlaD
MDEDVTAELRLRIDAHVRACGGCRAIYDGVRNVITLVGDFQTIELPPGFSQRLRQRLSKAAAAE